MKSAGNARGVGVLLACVLGCASSEDNNCVSGSCELPPAFDGVINQPTPSGMAGPMPVPANDDTEGSPSPVRMLPSPMEAPDPLLEPPLTDAERSRLADVEGLFVADPWNGTRATLVTEEKVLRAYLDWKSRFYGTCSDGSSYVLKTGVNSGDQVVSEGIAYGMLITVAVGDRIAFDGLWKHYRDRRNGNGLMNWRYDPCGVETGGNGASDADLDAAMGLWLAESRWGSYREDALGLMTAIATHETQVCDDGRIVLKPGDAWGGCGDIVNPSYFSPGYYRRFAEVQPDRADFWKQFTGDTYSLLRSYQEQLDGLIPDWARPDGSLITDGRQVFGYEAVRGPWRVAIDYAWSGDADARAFLEAMNAHVDGQGGIAALADGEDYQDKRNSAFLGTLSLPGIVKSPEQLDDYVREWEAYEKDDVWYYQATLRLLALLVAGGFFPADY
jgi:endoglucanase